MFNTVEMAPSDPILGLTDAFNADPNPEKINLSVGVYKDADGKTLVLDSVKKAQHKILGTEITKSYKPIQGDPAYGKVVQAMLFGADHEILDAGRIVTAHTPGGTGALRVAGDLVKKIKPTASIWLSDPTWANHPNIFNAAGLELKAYPYFNAETNGLAFGSMINAIKQIPQGDVILLHGCCHNPTGVDPTPEQWRQIGLILAERGVLPLLDFAYQGFGDGLKEDAAGLRIIAEICPEMLICSSFSKNFSLYNERVGAVSAIARDREQAQAVLSQVKQVIRSNYSNPPAHGAAIITTILSDPALTAQWEQELAAMRDRIRDMREAFVAELAAAGINADYGFIANQRGMFSFSGLTKSQVGKLREQYSIYIVGSGRINVAGMNQNNLPILCKAIASVIAE